jgi:hypothetical protein
VHSSNHRGLPEPLLDSADDQRGHAPAKTKLLPGEDGDRRQPPVRLVPLEVRPLQVQLALQLEQQGAWQEARLAGREGAQRLLAQPGQSAARPLSAEQASRGRQRVLQDQVLAWLQLGGLWVQSRWRLRRRRRPLQCPVLQGL